MFILCLPSFLAARSGFECDRSAENREAARHARKHLDRQPFERRTTFSIPFVFTSNLTTTKIKVLISSSFSLSLSLSLNRSSPCRLFRQPPSFRRSSTKSSVYIQTLPSKFDHTGRSFWNQLLIAKASYPAVDLDHFSTGWLLSNQSVWGNRFVKVCSFQLIWSSTGCFSHLFHASFVRTHKKYASIWFCVWLAINQLMMIIAYY